MLFIDLKTTVIPQYHSGDTQATLIGQRLVYRLQIDDDIVRAGKSSTYSWLHFCRHKLVRDDDHKHYLHTGIDGEKY